MNIKTNIEYNPHIGKNIRILEHNLKDINMKYFLSVDKYSIMGYLEFFKTNNKNEKNLIMNFSTH